MTAALDLFFYGEHPKSERDEVELTPGNDNCAQVVSLRRYRQAPTSAPARPLPRRIATPLSNNLHSPIRAKHGSGGIVTRAGGAEQVAQGGWPQTFYWNLNQDVSRPWTMKEILELYDTLLPTGANTDLSFDYTVLREEVLRQVGEDISNPRYEVFRSEGVNNGVGDDLSTN